MHVFTFMLPILNEMIFKKRNKMNRKSYLKKGISWMEMEFTIKNWNEGKHYSEHQRQFTYFMNVVRVSRSGASPYLRTHIYWSVSTHISFIKKKLSLVKINSNRSTNTHPPHIHKHIHYTEFKRLTLVFSRIIFQFIDKFNTHPHTHTTKTKFCCHFLCHKFCCFFLYVNNDSGFNLKR